MSYFFSQVKMKRFLFTGLVLILMAGILGGCKTEAEDDSTKGLPDALLGKWVSSNYGDWYEITRSAGTETFKISFDGTSVASQGAIRDVTNFNSESGVIIVEFSTGLTNAARPFGAIYYLGFTGRTVSFNSAFDATAADFDANTATLEQAKGKFTQARMGDWIDPSFAVPYTKQN